MQGASLKGAHLEFSNFENADLEYADASWANLLFVKSIGNASGADFSYSVFSKLPTDLLNAPVLRFASFANSFFLQGDVPAINGRLRKKKIDNSLTDSTDYGVFGGGVDLRNTEIAMIDSNYADLLVGGPWAIIEQSSPDIRGVRHANVDDLLSNLSSESEIVNPYLSKASLTQWAKLTGLLKKYKATTPNLFGIQLIDRLIKKAEVKWSNPKFLRHRSEWIASNLCQESNSRLLTSFIMQNSPGVNYKIEGDSRFSRRFTPPNFDTEVFAKAVTFCNLGGNNITEAKEAVAMWANPKRFPQLQVPGMGTSDQFDTIDDRR